MALQGLSGVAIFVEGETVALVQYTAQTKVKGRVHTWWSVMEEATTVVVTRPRRSRQAERAGKQRRLGQLGAPR